MSLIKWNYSFFLILTSLFIAWDLFSNREATKKNDLILSKVHNFFPSNLEISLSMSRYVNISGYFTVIKEKGEKLGKVYFDQPFVEIIATIKQNKFNVYFNPSFLCILYEVFPAEYLSENTIGPSEILANLEQFRNFLKENDLPKVKAEFDSNLSPESLTNIKENQEEFNSIFANHHQKFVQLSPSQLENETIVGNSIEISTQLAFGTNFLPPIQEIVRGLAFGEIEIIDPTGKFTTLTFENTVVFRGLANFRNTSNKNSTYSTYIYYYSKCFNPFRSAYSTKNKVTFFPFDENGNRDDSRESYVNNDNNYEILLRNASKRLSKIYNNYLTVFHKTSINSNEELFKKEQKKLSSSQNLFFLPETIDYSNDSAVFSGLHVASNRAFGSKFIEILSIRKGVAYGKMNILQSDGTNKLFTFEGRNVYYELFDRNGALLSNSSYNSNPFIYEGLLRFTKDENYEENQETIDLIVYYFSQCFNPLQIPHSDLSVNVTFFPENEEPVRIAHHPRYNEIYNESMESLHNNTHVFEPFQFLEETPPQIHKGKTLVIIDVSPSMSSIQAKVQREAEEIVGKDYFKKFPGCFFSINPNDNTISQLLEREIDRDREIDLIYFLADFQDHVENGVKNYLLKKFQERNIKLILISYENEPKFELKSLAESTGGSIIIKKYK